MLPLFEHAWHVWHHRRFGCARDMFEQIVMIDTLRNRPSAVFAGGMFSECCERQTESHACNHIHLLSEAQREVFHFLSLDVVVVLFFSGFLQRRVTKCVHLLSLAWPTSSIKQTKLTHTEVAHRLNFRVCSVWMLDSDVNLWWKQGCIKSSFTYICDRSIALRKTPSAVYIINSELDLYTGPRKGQCPVACMCWMYSHSWITLQCWNWPL